MITPRALTPSEAAASETVSDRALKRTAIVLRKLNELRALEDFPSSSCRS